MPICFRCKRDLSAEKPVLLPDAECYCASCCENMATDAFEMETGKRFTDWIEDHQRLDMRYQPIELSVRRLQFIFPLACALAGAAVILWGCWKFVDAGFPLRYLASYLLLVVQLGVLVGGIVSERMRGALPHLLTSLLALALPIVSALGIWHFGKPAAYVALGVFSTAVFGVLAVRGLLALLRASDFELSLEKGVFNLRHGKRAETFGVKDLTQVCVVRPGTVGATEGALGFKDGRMLTLDTCLSDLHALGVVLDLRFRDDFPPSAEDLARERRTKLRKIRGLS